MSDRLEALRGKLPEGVLSLIRSYDSHLLSDLIRDIEFQFFPGHLYAASSLQLKSCDVWPPLAREMKRRIDHNFMLNRVWLPTLCYDAKVWTMSFPRWQFETLEDLEYLPLWVKEEYRLKVR